MRVYLVSVLAGLNISCAALVTQNPNYTGEAPELNIVSEDVSKDKDHVWSSLVSYMTQRGFTITTIEKESGLFHSETIRVGPQYMNCSSAVPRGNPTFLQHVVTLTVTVSEKDDGISNVSISTRMMGLKEGMYDIVLGQLSNEWIKCPTTGILEEELFTSLR